MTAEFALFTWSIFLTVLSDSLSQNYGLYVAPYSLLTWIKVAGICYQFVQRKENLQELATTWREEQWAIEHCKYTKLRSC